MNLRYYTHENWDTYLKDFFYVMNLLRRINEEVCPVEIDLNKDKEEIWKNDLLPQTRVIKKNTGKTAVEWLKAGKGKKNLYVYGTLAVVDNGAVIWITKGDGVKRALERILENPEEGIDNIFKEMKESSNDENTVLNNFIQSNIISGQIRREVEVGVEPVKNKTKEDGDSYKRYQFAKNIVTKRIDLIIESDDDIWLIEGKSKFDSKKAQEALGQILIYEELYRSDYEPVKNIRKAIVFGKPTNIEMIGVAESIQQIEKIFLKHELDVFMEGRDF